MFDLFDVIIHISEGLKGLAWPAIVSGVYKQLTANLQHINENELVERILADDKERNIDHFKSIIEFFASAAEEGPDNSKFDSYGAFMKEKFDARNNKK